MNKNALTPTELQLTIAQVNDRLMRLAKAQGELQAFEDSDECEEDGSIAEKCRELREKYNIPEGVYLFGEGLTPRDISRCKPYLAAWVRGKLMKDQCEELFFYFDECHEADWGWIMMERPHFYYSPPGDSDYDALFNDMIAFGTRSHLRNRKLQRLIRIAA